MKKEIVKLLGNYNELLVYYIKNKYGDSIFYENKYYLIPSFIAEPENISLLKAVKIIENRKSYLEKKSIENNNVQEQNSKAIST